jgi:uncharacterized protein YqgC (DUF456 family)
MEVKHGFDLLVFAGVWGLIGGIIGAIVGAVTADEDSERAERASWGFLIGIVFGGLASGAFVW